MKSEGVKSLAPPATLRPSKRPSCFTCHELVELASLTHYLLRLDRKCRLLVAKRTTAPFNEASEIRECFRTIELELAEIPRGSYHLLVDARHGPSRNDPRPTPSGGASRATDVQTLLSSFTAGVQRGLDEARQRSARPTVDAGPTGANGNGVGRR